MAVAAHVFDKTPAPPILRKANNAKAWGLRDYFGVPAMELPAGELARINTVLSYYDACRSYLSAGGKTVDWTRRNPQAWEIVSWCLAERIKGRKRGNR